MSTRVQITKNLLIKFDFARARELDAGSIPVRANMICIRDGVVGNISACHADARGSIPRRGESNEF